MNYGTKFINEYCYYTVMKNREKFGILPAIAFALPSFAGCRSFVSLTEEEQAMIGQSIDYANAETSLVEYLAAAANRDTVFDSTGTNGATAFSDDLETTIALLNDYYEQGRIVGYIGADINRDGVGDVASYEGDVIVVNLETLHSEQGIDSYQLIHEAGHAIYGSHNSSLNHGKIGEEYNTQSAEKVIDAQDYPYLLTLLYYPADVALDDPYDSVSRQIENMQGRIKNEGLAPQDAYNELATAYFCQPEEVWADRATNSAFLGVPYLPSLDILESEFYTGYLEGDISEYLKDIYTDALIDFAKQYTIITPIYNCPVK